MGSIKKNNFKRNIKSNVMNRNRRMVKANTDVAPEATDLLFEAEDVAQLVAEITGQDVEVTADENEVTFDIAGDKYGSYTVEAEGDEEIVAESVRRLKTSRKVTASRNMRKPVGKTVKKFANKRK